jgi:hypothetical protein
MNWCKHCGDDINVTTSSLTYGPPNTWVSVPMPDDRTPPSITCTSSPDGFHHPAK